MGHELYPQQHLLQNENEINRIKTNEKSIENKMKGQSNYCDL